MQDSLSDLLKSCEREQLHLSGAIQTHGALLHVSDAGIVTHASANCGEQIGVASDALLGRPDTAICAGIATMARLPRAAEGDRVALYRERFGATEQDAALAKTKEGWLVELYSDATAGDRRHRLHAAPQLYELRKHGIAALCEQAIAAVQRETGFDKVMAYRFREDWSGEVVAEVSLDPQLDRYLGHRFPASDIPKIARDLYLKNPSRLIADVHSATVPIVGQTAAPLDLTFSELRSVSPVHMEYLRNMQVGASCSFAVAMRGQLWGLIACHHAVAKTVPLWNRNRCVEYVKDLAFAIATHETDQRMRFIDRIDSAIEALLEGIGDSASLAHALETRTARVLELVGATGAAFISGDRCVRLGNAPDEEQIRNLVELKAADGLFATDNLVSVFPGYASLSPIASGVLAVHAPPRVRDAGIGARFVWFRPEERSSVVWAGDPSKGVEWRDGMQVISPRTSFSRWTEIMEGRSRPWTTQDLVAAQKFRTSILRWTTRTP